MSGEKNARGGKPKSKAKKPAKTKASTVVKVKKDSGAAKRVGLAREKLAEAMKDPEMRDQIVRAIRAMIRDGRSE